MSEQPTVFIVDDDREVRDALQLLLESVGLRVETFDSALSYLQQYDETRPGCLISDVRMPGMSGLDLQEELLARKLYPPMVIVTGHGDVPMAVRAVKAGAVDFIEKPFNSQAMLDVVHRALEKDAAQRGEVVRLLDIEARYRDLTPREREVLKHVIAGKRNKNIAAEMFISQSTVEAHRARVMEKMEASSLSDLMRMALALGLL
jgi:two-component system response regulator FixJ